MRAISFAVVLLACGASSPSQLYLPLAVGNTWSYDCGGGVVITDTVSQAVMVHGQQGFALELQFPNAAAQTLLLANDGKGNVTFHGYLVGGAVQPAGPVAYLSANPQAAQRFDYPAADGGTVSRRFVNVEPTNPTALGTFTVASYNDDASGQDIWGYTPGKGITEQDHGAFDCTITSLQLR